MIYKCTNPSCGCLTEEEAPPALCPECGSSMREIREEEMTGRDWAALGGYWTGLRKNEKRILYCYRMAAAKGNAWGICNLGWCMEAGVGIDADPKQAVWLYEQAAQAGYIPALCNLAACLQEGVGNCCRRRPSGDIPGLRCCWPAVMRPGMESTGMRMRPLI